jgi:uncharacterized membrane-anchored protein YjiN (DUF445 family)
MGWSGGSGLFDSLIKTMKRNVPDEKARANVYKTMIRAFEDEDADTLDECRGQDPVFDKALGKQED